MGPPHPVANVDEDASCMCDTFDMDIDILWIYDDYMKHGVHQHDNCLPTSWFLG